MPKVQRGNISDIYRRQYVFGVQISNLKDVKIGSAKYNFPTKTEAVKWAVKNTGKKQYASIVKVLNKYYKDASYNTRHLGYHTIAYESGIGCGTVRQSPIGPILIDEGEDYFYRINPEGRLYGKTSIEQIPLAPTDSFYNKDTHRMRYYFT